MRIPKAKYKVGEWVKTKSGVVAQILGMGYYQMGYWEYRLISRGSKRSFYRKEREIAGRIRR